MVVWLCRRAAYLGLGEAQKVMSFEIFLATSPGLEKALYEEVRLKGFKGTKTLKGGVSIQGGWPEVWRANLWLRGASKVLARIATFKALHLSELETRAKQVGWTDILRAEYGFRVETSCTKSRIYHTGAAAERIERAISAGLGIAPSSEAPIKIMARIERDICTISIDSSGELLHKRGFKKAINKAPMRENMAALFLGQCGYKGTEPLYDPMCGSGTFVIEAAEVAARLNPGRARCFAFEKLKSFDSQAWDEMRHVRRKAASDVVCYGSDRDSGAIKMSAENAALAGVDHLTEFNQLAISNISPPSPIPGLVIVNPPYGGRLGDKRKLISLYQSFGQVMRERFAGWRVGLITDEASLARATSLPFLPTSAPVQHGGLRVTLYRTEAL